MTALLAAFVLVLICVVVRQRQSAQSVERRSARSGVGAAGAAQGDRGASPAEVLAWMRHEIRAPVKAIVAMADVLLEGELQPRQREQVGRLRDSGAALSRTFDDLLDLCRMDAGRLVLDAQPFNVREAVEMSLDEVAPLAAERRLDLSCHVTDDTPETVVGDAYRLRQILATLLMNAFRRTHAGAVTVSASARSVDGGHELRLVVRDSGAAVPRARAQAALQPLGAIVNSLDGAADVQDLGLAVCCGLATLMGGTLSLRNGAAGTEFELLILAAVPERVLEASRSRRRELPVSRTNGAADLDDGPRVPAAPRRSPRHPGRGDADPLVSDRWADLLLTIREGIEQGDAGAVEPAAQTLKAMALAAGFPSVGSRCTELMDGLGSSATGELRVTLGLLDVEIAALQRRRAVFAGREGSTLSRFSPQSE